MYNRDVSKIQFVSTEVQIALGGLEEHFVVVNWDQPGAGKSFHAVPHSELTPERYVADARALTLYLSRRFDQPRIYVLGESWRARNMGCTTN